MSNPACAALILIAARSRGPACMWARTSVRVDINYGTVHVKISISTVHAWIFASTCFQNLLPTTFVATPARCMRATKRRGKIIACLITVHSVRSTCVLSSLQKSGFFWDIWQSLGQTALRNYSNFDSLSFSIEASGFQDRAAGTSELVANFKLDRFNKCLRRSRFAALCISSLDATHLTPPPLHTDITKLKRI